MSAPVDTSAEAVEALAAGCEYYAAGEAAAMLRRLRAERDDARQERDHWKWQAEYTRGHAERAEAALATARADALREAAVKAEQVLKDVAADLLSDLPNSATREALVDVLRIAAETLPKDILALIPKENPYAE